MEDKLPKSVRCTGQSFISKNIHDITSTVLEYENCYVQINVNWLNPFKQQLLTIVGTNGMITFDDTVEEKILDLQKRKVKLAEDLISTDQGFVKNLTKEDISALLT